MHRFTGNTTETTGACQYRRANLGRRLGWLLGLALFMLGTSAKAATFVVNSTGNGADAAPGNGVCADGGGNCTLRAAISEANLIAGNDTINFSIGSGAQTINVPATLDVITDTVTINGNSQPGFSGAPLIQLSGPGGGSVPTGLAILADNCVVRGLVLNGFSIGVRIEGMPANLIAEGNVVAGCYIGTNAAGTAIAAVPNGYGVYLSDGGSGTGAQNNTIGGLTAADRNVISGNSNHSGIIIGGSITSGNIIVGNYIGTNAAGTAAIPNSYVAGIFLASPDNIVGGTTANARNVISGNSNGIFIGSANAHGNLIRGNYIGTNANGTAALGNDTGIFIGDDTGNANSGAHDNIVGGSVTGAGNLISGNTSGVTISNRFTADNTTGNQVQGNLIGTNAAGSGAVPNTLGVLINGGSKGNSIGDTAAGTGNTIAFNTFDGVNVSTAFSLTPNGNSIRGNSIHDNGGLGINLQPTGEAATTITANDAFDSDSGPNTLQNFPVITSFTPGSTTQIGGTFNSTANQSFTLDFYRSPAPDASGNGEGQTYLGAPLSGSTTVTTNASGNATFSLTFNGNLAGQYLSATATNSNGDTSEFGPAVQVPPTLSINDVTVTEGDSGSLNATFTVTLLPASSGTVTVDFATADGSTNPATANNDYTDTTGTLTFAAGQISKTISVPILGDVLDEDNETFFVNLTNATGALVSDAQGLGMIKDNDATPSLSINDINATEGDTGTSDANFTVTLNKPSGRTVFVQWKTVNGVTSPATANVDFTSVPLTTLIFNPGETSKQVMVPILNDLLNEPTETFRVQLSGAGNATIGDTSGLCNILDNDPLPSFSINDVSVSEGSSLVDAAFTLSLSAPSGRIVSVDYKTVEAGSPKATAGADYNAVPLTTLNFAPGETTKTVKVTILPDSIDEVDEQFQVLLSNSKFASIADGSGLGTIVDNDPTPTIKVSDTIVTEGNSGTVLLAYTVSLTNPSSRNISVKYQTANSATNPATAGADYVALGLTNLNFAPGETTKTVNVTVNGDVLDENDEHVTLTLSSPTNATIGDGSGEGIITDDDALPNLAISDALTTEGNSGTKTLSFTVSLDAPSGRTVSVDYKTINGGSPQATAGVDYVASALTTLTFTAGQTSKTINITINGDTTVEGNEQFQVSLSNRVNCTIVDGVAVGTILNDDGADLTFQADEESS